MLVFSQQIYAIMPPQIPLEDFFRNPEKSAYQISPDGKFISFMAPYESRMNIFVQKTGSDKATRLTSETDRDIAGYYWANADRILFLKDSGGDENFALYGVDKDGKNSKCLTCFEGVRTQIIDELEDQPDFVIIGLNQRNAMVFDPYRLNIKTGEKEMLAENPGNIQGWMTDHEGKLRIAIAIVDGVNTQLLYRDDESQEFEPVLTTSFKESLSPNFFTFDNKHLYATSNLGRDKSAAVIFDPKTAKETEVLYENEDFDVGGISYSRKRKVITAASYTSWKRERHFFDDEARTMFEKLESLLSGYEIAITASDKAEENYIIRTYSDRSMGAYYLYDKTKEKLTKIQDVSPWLDEDQMAEVKPIQYRSRDGLVIHGYLTLPKGVEAKNLPVVVNPHGGPWARDNWGFNPEVQFLANRGFAVLQMNFRGSTGYGKAFWEASFKEWGLSMQNDITDGVYWLIREGIADKDRVAIYGASYGGYATLQGLVVTPTLYAAGVDYVGVSNLFTFMQTIPPYWKPMLDMMYEMVGNPEANKQQFEATSPAMNADKIIAPLFVAQGANDPRVNIAESDQIVEAMRTRGIEVEYMVKDNEGHGFRNEENRFDFYRAMEAFLKNHLLN
ncbi:MAG: S9 family peptidase [Bacteroidales bacterium]|nr:S9 family peptidase [Bacteroidales bacterium]MDD4086107.1 S9 family peptidase [Bacteroidales bacterium]MDY0084915.1 S9 family peptidase [Bacteroidales bacterium]